MGRVKTPADPELPAAVSPLTASAADGVTASNDRIGVAGSEVRTAQVPRHLSPVPALTQRWLPGVEAET